MKKNSFLKIPINRIIALILLDIMSIIVASVGALYIRFDFNFSAIPVGYFEMLENIIVSACEKAQNLGLKNVKFIK